MMLRGKCARGISALRRKGVDQFLPRGCAMPAYTARCYASAVYAVVVCFSVCHTPYCIKMAKNRITLVGKTRTIAQGL